MLRDTPSKELENKIEIKHISFLPDETVVLFQLPKKMFPEITAFIQKTKNLVPLSFWESIKDETFEIYFRSDSKNALSSLQLFIEEFYKNNLIDLDTILHFVARFGHVEQLKYVIDNLKMSVDAKNHLGLTPLDEAVRHPNLETARYLARLMANQQRVYPKEMDDHAGPINPPSTKLGLWDSYSGWLGASLTANEIKISTSIVDLAREERNKRRALESLILLKSFTTDPHVKIPERAEAYYEIALTLCYFIKIERNEVQKIKYCNKAKEFCELATRLKFDVKGLNKIIQDLQEFGTSCETVDVQKEQPNLTPGIVCS